MAKTSDWRSLRNGCCLRNLTAVTKVLKSLPDARLCLSSCLVVLVNSLLEVVKVLGAEKEKGRVRINVLTEVEVRSEVRAAHREAMPRGCPRSLW